MDDLEIRNYSSVAIVHDEHLKLFLFNVYDDTYPRPAYRGRANLIGGNRTPSDASPQDTLERELREEFNPEAARQRGFATKRDIQLVKDSLVKCTIPYQDFIVTLQAPPKVGAEKGFEFGVLTSVYFTILPDNVLECLARNIATNRRISSEGLLAIKTREELEQGKVQFAWDSGVEAEHYLRDN